MKHMVVIVLALALALSISAPAASTTQAMGGPSRVTPDDLPVAKPPAETISVPSTPTGDLGNAVGPGVQPERPGKPNREPAPNKWAVVVGIADYQGVGSDLWHSDEDAREMASALIDNHGFASGNVKVLLNRKATYTAVVSAISWLVSNEDAESTVVFFFSGHGFRVADSEGWDTDTESDGYDEGIVSYDFYGLPDGFLRAKLSGLESKKVAFCFGSCHSGGMFDDEASDLQGANRVITSACQADGYAWDYLLLGNTLWGKYFVDEGLLQGLADPLDSDSIEEAHAYAYPRVTSEQSDSNPQLSDRYVGDLVP